MNQSVDRKSGGESVVRTRTSKSIFVSKILIVDDDPLSCRLLEAILKKHQFRNLRFADGGISALEQIDSFRPDLVLLDMQMPDLSGLEVVERVRQRPELIDMAILAQTATVDRKEMGTLFMAGVSDFLSKPINPAELISRVAVHLERQTLLRELRDYRGRTSQELEAAQRMQAELLPGPLLQQEIAHEAGLRIGCYARPSSEIGGDLWGLLPISAGVFGIFLADFAGHGVTAALNTFRLHALIHEYRALHGEPVELVTMLNERLARLLPPGQFATFLYVVIDSEADLLRYVSAGAPPPIVTTGRDGPSEFAEANGVPLGVARGVQYDLHERPFTPESRLLLFSDGLPEFPDDYGDRIGDDGLLGAISVADPELTPHEVIELVCNVAGIGPESALPDDTTIICIDRRVPSCESPGERSLFDDDWETLSPGQAGALVLEQQQ
ncbi:MULTISPECIES: fused response regulator/phosphatase [Rhodopseudomonas]|uniref:PP2C family protein-serine/threonine phosphatase n=1 Tax=Rhodopseudomonas TaxID=1073 RepID=UPI0009BAB7CE|nr:MULTISPECIES: fused response regulator/phosphatase [Rhodopseudomonas]MDF3809607.1 fused response regulator/phosphatase [Rhodopseudomonas sp. BAL398]WOK17802.1 fused response regulator/phosphatase [Rhodopseudomonas sp. BAL398]